MLKNSILETIPLQETLSRSAIQTPLHKKIIGMKTPKLQMQEHKKQISLSAVHCDKI